ncbi:dihydrofolate reductase [Penaeicola halotolerans]|uniref:dihydrofolate reductase n=1 Tax=Penaeicola halotolerans TaxID=2793196 RepID=UPI001CF872AD|nr:dihydrofolate reductase [Penaeicola halotolerans]
MKKSIVVAVADNQVIGKDNDLIWKLPKDLKHFKETTSGHHIIMGRKTFESMGKPLPNRTSVVITRQKDYTVPEGHHVVHSLEEAFSLCEQKDLEKVFVLGGAEIYKMALPLVDELIITEVKESFEGDAYFPKIDRQEWKEVSRTFHPKDDKNPHDMYFVYYQKIV